MTRGDIVTVAAGSGFGGKSRPAVIIQSDQFELTPTVALCLFTTEIVDAMMIRVDIAPTSANGLAAPSWLMTDKIISVRRAKIGRHVGQLASADMERLNRALILFLELGA